MIGGIVIIALMLFVGFKMQKHGLSCRMFNDKNRI